MEHEAWWESSTIKEDQGHARHGECLCRAHGLGDRGRSGGSRVTDPVRVPERHIARRARRADDARAEAEPPRRLPSGQSSVVFLTAFQDDTHEKNYLESDGIKHLPRTVTCSEAQRLGGRDRGGSEGSEGRPVRYGGTLGMNEEKR